jgi:hypothetical protein
MHNLKLRTIVLLTVILFRIETAYDGWVLNWLKFDSGGGCSSVLEQESHSSKDPEKYTNTFAFYKSVINAA